MERGTSAPNPSIEITVKDKPATFDSSIKTDYKKALDIKQDNKEKLSALNVSSETNITGIVVPIFAAAKDWINIKKISIPRGRIAALGIGMAIGAAAYATAKKQFEDLKRDEKDSKQPR